MATAFRPCGDFYSAGQDAWSCEYCNGNEGTCLCDDADEAPRCLSCDDILIGDYCADCEDLGLAPVVRISPTQVWA